MKKSLLGIAPFLLLFTLSACNTPGFAVTKNGENYSSSTSSSVSSATPTAYVGVGCKVAGCNSQLCVNEDDPDMTSTCEWTAEYACYQTARCERQDDGECGWSPTDALGTCLESAAAR